MQRPRRRVHRLHRRGCVAAAGQQIEELHRAPSRVLTARPAGRSRAGSCCTAAAAAALRSFAGDSAAAAASRSLRGDAAAAPSSPRSLAGDAAAAAALRSLLGDAAAAAAGCCLSLERRSCLSCIAFRLIVHNGSCLTGCPWIASAHHLSDGSLSGTCLRPTPGLVTITVLLGCILFCHMRHPNFCRDHVSIHVSEDS